MRPGKSMLGEAGDTAGVMMLTVRTDCLSATALSCWLSALRSSKP